MNYNCPWYFKIPNHVPPTVCDAIISQARELELRRARIGLNPDQSVLDDQTRNNKIAFISRDSWLSGILTSFGAMANDKAHWNFHIAESDDIQIASYKEGEKYDWHTDESILSRMGAVQRKITVVLQLNDTSEFTGGGLFLKGVEGNLLANQGDIVAFPSYMEHIAETVTSGERLSAATWIMGNYFS
jgi:PKHD-type hydroxylase